MSSGQARTSAEDSKVELLRVCQRINEAVRKGYVDMPSSINAALKEAIKRAESSP